MPAETDLFGYGNTSVTKEALVEFKPNDIPDWALEDEPVHAFVAELGTDDEPLPPIELEAKGMNVTRLTHAFVNLPNQDTPTHRKDSHSRGEYEGHNIRGGIHWEELLREGERPDKRLLRRDRHAQMIARATASRTRRRELLRLYREDVVQSTDGQVEEYDIGVDDKLILH